MAPHSSNLFGLGDATKKKRRNKILKLQSTVQVKLAREALATKAVLNLTYGTYTVKVENRLSEVDL